MVVNQVLPMCGKLDIVYVHNLFVVPVSSCTSSRKVVTRLFVPSLRNVCPMMWMSFVIVASRYSVFNLSALYFNLQCLTYSGVVLGSCRFSRVMHVIGDCIMSQCVWVGVKVGST